MAKIQVVDSTEGTRVPFLRGILTRSLHEAGLDFEQAYELASSIRDELGDSPEITTEALQEQVLAHLRDAHPAEVVAGYRRPAASAPVTIIVRDEAGQAAPFSRGHHHRRALRRLLRQPGRGVQRGKRRMSTRPKGLMIILDGLGDRSSAALAGATPLEAALTPQPDRSPAPPTVV